MRTTKSEVEAVFKQWLTAIGGREAKSYNDVGGYCLDHNSVYGGWEIQQIHNEHGGVSVVIYTRLSSFYFVSALRMSIASFQHKNINERLDHVSHCPKMGNGCAHFNSSGEVK
jgi:hypothetical protein